MDHTSNPTFVTDRSKIVSLPIYAKETGRSLTRDRSNSVSPRSAEAGAGAGNFATRDIKAGYRRVTYQVEAKLLEAWGQGVRLRDGEINEMYIPEKLRIFDFASFADEIKANLCIRDPQSGDVIPSGLVQSIPYAIEGVWLSLYNRIKDTSGISLGADNTWPLMVQSLVRAMIGERRLEIEVLEQIEARVMTSPDPKHPGNPDVADELKTRFKLFKNLAWRARKWLSKHGHLEDAVQLSPNLPTLLEVKVVMLGSAGVGKTTASKGYVKGINADSISEPSTIGSDFFVKTIDVPHNFFGASETTKIRATIFDTAGQETFHSIIPSLVASADVVIVVQSADTQNEQQSLTTDTVSPIKYLDSDSDFMFVGNKSKELTPFPPPPVVSVQVGAASSQRKSIQLPHVGFKVSSKPRNKPPNSEGPTFSADVNGDVLVVTRTDAEIGWEDELELSATDCSRCYCGLCNELMCSPVSLNPCGHFFCLECIDAWINAKPSLEFKQPYLQWLIKCCPICRCRYTGSTNTVDGATLSQIISLCNDDYADIISENESMRCDRRTAQVLKKLKHDIGTTSRGTEDNFHYFSDFARFHSRRPQSNRVPIVRFRNKTDLELKELFKNDVSSERTNSESHHDQRISVLSKASALGLDGDSLDLFDLEWEVFSAIRQSRDPRYELPPMIGPDDTSTSLRDTLRQDLARGYTELNSQAVGKYSYFWGSSRTPDGGVDEMFEKSIRAAAASKYQMSFEQKETTKESQTTVRIETSTSKRPKQSRCGKCL